MDRGKNKRFILIPFLVAFCLFWLTVGTVSAGTGDGDTTSYINNKDFEDGNTFWTLNSSAVIHTCDSTNTCLDVTNGYGQQTHTLPAGVLRAQFRYWVYAGGGVRIRVINASTMVEVGNVGFATSGGWRNADTNPSSNITIPSDGDYIIRFEDINTGSWVDDITITVDGSGPEIEPPEEPPTIGQLITATCLITLTGGITQTVSGNLLDNPSFEQTVNNVNPEGWELLSGGDVAADVYQFDSMLARDGSRYLKLTDENYNYIIRQTISVPISTSYKVGAFINYLSTVPTGTVRFGLSYQDIVYTDTSSTFYTSNGYDGVYIDYNNLDGVSEFYIEIPEQPAIYINAVDNAFVIPVDGEGNLSCAAVEEFIEGGGNPGETTPGEYAPIQEVFGLPVPLAGAGEVCYTCEFPYGRGVEGAIAWLGCVIRNMFSCSLRRWLKELLNVMLSSFAFLPMLVNWINANLQPFINWLGSFFQSSLDLYATGAALAAGGVQIDEAGTTFYDVLIALINTPANILAQVTNLVNSIAGLIFGTASVLGVIVGLFVDLLSALIPPLVSIVNLMFSAISALWGALAQPALGIQDFVNNGSSPDVNITEELEAAGINDTKVFTVIIWGMAIMDAFILDFSLKPLVWFACGVLGLSTIYWLLKKWDVITPY